MTAHLREVQVRHGARTLVDVTDVRLDRGRPVTIVGESGSGKSLLAQALMGTLAPDLTAEGSLTVGGSDHDLRDADDRRSLWGHTLSLLPQEPMLALDPTMRVGAQVAEGVPGTRASHPSARRAARDQLAAVGLPHVEAAFPHTLSGGMAQRVAFAAATIGGARLLIADEPSKGLDDRSRQELAELLRGHVAAGGGLLTITHDLDLARGLGGEVLVMREARVVERGPVQQVLAQPAHPWTRRLVDAEPANWTRSPTPHGRGRETLVTADGLSKRFGSQQLFDDLTVTIRAGDRLALSGPSGSGKTTLGNVLLRLVAPDRGQVRHAPALRDGRVQKLYQDPTLSFPTHVPLRQAMGDVVRRHGLERRRLDGLMADLRLDPGLLARRPGQVSGGELQRLAIIRAMLLAPRVVFADEPTSRLDLLTQQETVRALMDQIDSQDCALVLVTHDEALAAAVTDRRITLPGAHPTPARQVA